MATKVFDEKLPVVLVDKKIKRGIEKLAKKFGVSSATVRRDAYRHHIDKYLR